MKTDYSKLIHSLVGKQVIVHMQSSDAEDDSMFCKVQGRLQHDRIYNGYYVQNGNFELLFEGCRINTIKGNEIVLTFNDTSMRA